MFSKCKKVYSSKLFISFTLTVICLQISISSSLISKRPPYTIINFNLEEDALQQSEENFIESDAKVYFEKLHKFRGESYLKAKIAGLRKFRKNSEELFKTFNGINQTKSKDVHDSEKKFVCYYTIPTVNDMPYPIFPETIDPFLCTHILISFARVQNGTVVPNQLRDIEFYHRITQLKSKNPQLKILLSIGSSNLHDAAGNEFVRMISSNNTRIQFIKESLIFMKSYGFDGLDFDWEFPAWDSPMEQKEQFVALFREYRDIMHESEISSILSAAVPSPKQIVDIGFDIQGLAETLDFVNLMTYDFHTYSWYAPLTGPNAPLFNSSVEFGFLSTLNTAWAANYWHQNGMPTNKIMIGIPTYGRSYRLVDGRNHEFYSLAADIGGVGKQGIASYFDVCKFMEGNGTQLVFHNESRVPYTFVDREWISFENEKSAAEKAQWIKENNFGGIMIWSINHDDAYKQCNTTTTAFPIITSAKRNLYPSVNG